MRSKGIHICKTDTRQKTLVWFVQEPATYRGIKMNLFVPSKLTLNKTVATLDTQNGAMNLNHSEFIKIHSKVHVLWESIYTFTCTPYVFHTVQHISGTITGCGDQVQFGFNLNECVIVSLQKEGFY